MSDSASDTDSHSSQIESEFYDWDEDTITEPSGIRVPLVVSTV